MSTPAAAQASASLELVIPQILIFIIIAVATLSTLVSGYYAAGHFKIDTDIGKLISPDLPWRRSWDVPVLREKTFDFGVF